MSNNYKSSNTKEKISIKDLVLFPISIVLIYFGGEYTVKSIIEISKILNIGVEVLSAIFVALGTSLPELVVSVVASSKRKFELAVGNVF